MTRNILLWLLVFATPSMLAAQQDTASVRMQRNCEMAEHALRTAAPDTDIAWAHQQIRACGAGRAEAAVADRLRRIRMVTDRAQLEDEWALSTVIRDASLFSVAVDIAGDQGASVPARVLGFRDLRTLLFPRQISEYEDLVGGPDERGWPRGGCSGAGTTHQMPFRGRPLAANWEQIARDVAERVLDDRSQPLDVRTAAACVLGRRVD